MPEQGLTREALATFIRDTTLPHIQSVIGADIAKLVKEQFALQMEEWRKQTPGGYAGHAFRESSTTNRPVMQPGQTAARCLRAVACAKMENISGRDGALEVLKRWGSGQLADEWQAYREEAKALGTTDPTQGGLLVPTQISAEMIELLRPAAVVRSLGPTIMQMPNGKLEINRISQGATAAYVGENQNISKTEEQFGLLRLTFRKLACLVPISNDLIRQSSPSADMVVRDDTVRAMAVREDKAFLRDPGTDSTPKGLRYWINATNVYAANGTVNLDNVTQDLGKALQAIMAADIPLIVQQNFDRNSQTPQAVIDVRPGWIFSPRTYRYLTTVRHTNGPYAFRDEMLRGTLFGFPFRVTSQVLETMTAADADTGGSQSEIYFGCFAHAIIGEALGLVVDASTDAAYYDGQTVQAAFSRDQTVIRVMQEHDFALRHDKSFVRIKNVTWAA